MNNQCQCIETNYYFDLVQLKCIQKIIQDGEQQKDGEFIDGEQQIDGEFIDGEQQIDGETQLITDGEINLIEDEQNQDVKDNQNDDQLDIQESEPLSQNVETVTKVFEIWWIVYINIAFSVQLQVQYLTEYEKSDQEYLNYIFWIIFAIISTVSPFYFKSIIIEFNLSRNLLKIKQKYQQLWSQFLDEQKQQQNYKIIFMVYYYLRKYVFTLIIINLNFYPFLQTVILSSMFLFFLFITIVFKPYNQKSDQIINCITEFLIFITMCMFVFLCWPSQKDKSQETQNQVGLIIFITIIVLISLHLFYMIGNIVYQLINKLQKKKKDKCLRRKNLDQKQKQIILQNTNLFKNKYDKNISKSQKTDINANNQEYFSQSSESQGDKSSSSCSNSQNESINTSKINQNQVNIKQFSDNNSLNSQNQNHYSNTIDIENKLSIENYTIQTFLQTSNYNYKSDQKKITFVPQQKRKQLQIKQLNYKDITQATSLDNNIHQKDLKGSEITKQKFQI